MGEDPTRTHDKQLRGWLSYAFASEVFVIVSLTLFLPICLEQFARDNGYLDREDRKEPCNSVAASPGGRAEARCVVKLVGLWIDSASFSLYVNSISVALQALTVISMGGIADHPPHRKRLLLMFAALGALSATLFLLLPSSSPIWPCSALLGICANVGFGASVVAMNAYIPILARTSPEVVELREQALEPSNSPAPARAANDLDADSNAPLLESADHSTEPDDTSQDYSRALSAATSRISSLGIALGYAAGILLLILTLIPVTLLKGSTFSLRLAISASGLWWAVFSLPAAAWLPGSDTTAEAELDHDREWSVTKEIAKAWKRLFGMLRWREIRRLRNTFQYLAAWFLLSDGFTTITSTAVLFGKTSLNMPPSSLVVVGIITPLAGIIGSLAWPRLQRRLGCTNLKVLTTLVIMASFVPAYGCLGFIPLFSQGRVKFGGLTTPGELYALAMYFGSVYGAFQGYARAFYAELIPPGEEARWYGLFSITDKSSSFVGPLVVGLIADTTGNIRYAFFFLVGMIWLAVPVLRSVNVERGRKDAASYVYTSGR
ncbi:MFS general substrate transporter [Punctularia strigosozonata HHB-11173 SS5]|uniref:MFS general substrate transporter n=1 Tax=Punctularia strigosozonata (strain HHB-11173) TaxID=741275 RepID=UPI0004416963|nr:MFS general substrate transporter [Punctularia strigosozonata HHB-11173 SS5]EIN06824.1 MFS general substrate transporter [Punctularia strigosozonata HHB-11173 SS5]